MTIVRSEPAGMVSAPEATPAATGTLNTTVVGRSGAETSTTTVATDVPETSALMKRVASPPPGATASPEHAANSRREASATNGELNGARDIGASYGRLRPRVREMRSLPVGVKLP